MSVQSIYVRNDLAMMIAL